MGTQRHQVLSSHISVRARTRGPFVSFVHFVVNLVPRGQKCALSPPAPAFLLLGHVDLQRRAEQEHLVPTLRAAPAELLPSGLTRFAHVARDRIGLALALDPLVLFRVGQGSFWGRREGEQAMLRILAMPRRRIKRG